MTNKIITAESIQWTTPAGDTIVVTFSEQPRKVRKPATGPSYRVRGVSRFVSGPAFNAYGEHPVNVDLGLETTDVLAWHMAWAP